MIERTSSQDQNRVPDPSPKQRLGFDLVSVPRWIIYFQGALLGVVATTFFIFGLMVGNFTSGGPTKGEPELDCRVSGMISFRDEKQSKPDSGAVVLLLPQANRPNERVAPRSISPKTFQPLDNPAIDLVHQHGGAVVRADQQGRFEVVVDGPADYFLVVVSRHKQVEVGETLTKKERAIISTFFSPVEDLLDDRAYYFSDVSATRQRVDLPAVNY